MTTNTQNINYYIELAQVKTPISSGTSKKCYDFGDVVLLESTSPEPQEMTEILKKIKQLGISSYEILAQQEVNGKHYILETKVAGTPIQEYGPKLNPNNTKEDVETNYEIERQYVKQYLKRLEEISKNYEQLKKFVKDYFQLNELGLFIDSSKSNNIYYDKNQGYSFLDLQIKSFTIPTSLIFNYIFYMISWCSSNIFSEDDILTEQAYLSAIVMQLRKICIELGKNPNEFLITTSSQPLLSDVNKREQYRIQYAYSSKEDYIKDNSNSVKS